MKNKNQIQRKNIKTKIKKRNKKLRKYQRKNQKNTATIH